METKINIADILEDCPEGSKLYTPCYGYVKFKSVINGYIVATDHDGLDKYFLPNGSIREEGECMLFPSKEQRDWSKFVKPVVPPFEVHQCKDSDTYYFIDTDLGVVSAIDFNIPISGTRRFRSGNYFNTKEQAEYAAGKVKELLLSMRKETK